MTDRPILFSAEMVRAILDGRKTQTRRVIKPQPWVDNMGNACWKDRNFGQSANHVPHIKALASPIPCSDTKRVLCPYGSPGDLLWVRETWRVHKSYDELNAARVYQAMGGDVAYCVDYFATNRSEDFWGRGRPSIHMPRWASRITLRITDVRVERLQDISEDDARAEGCKPVGWIDETDVGMSSYREGFSRLWNHINGPGAWDANPWVWALSFEMVKP